VESTEHVTPVVRKPPCDSQSMDAKREPVHTADVDPNASHGQALASRHRHDKIAQESDASKMHSRCCRGEDLMSLSLREYTQRCRKDKCEDQDDDNSDRISFVCSEEDDYRNHQKAYSQHGDKQPYEGVNTPLRIEVDKLVIGAGSLLRGREEKLWSGTSASALE